MKKWQSVSAEALAKDEALANDGFAQATKKELSVIAEPKKVPDTLWNLEKKLLQLPILWVRAIWGKIIQPVNRRER